MPRELITVQVGQCGNQIGCRFWDLALREHAAHNTAKVYDEPLSSFFKNVDLRHDPPWSLPVSSVPGPVHSLKARAIVVDMEEGVINSMLKSPLGALFDARSMLADVSGAGNNWAHGHHVYGLQYREQILERVRGEAEMCDSLQGFLLTHSLGGGTGSGLGTYLLSVLEEMYPKVFRFTASLFPSEDDDVVTSPYNAVLALHELIEHASCVLPIENQALMDLVAFVDSRVQRAAARASGTREKSLLGTDKKPYDRMNNLAANTLLGLTAGARFEGSLNVDINDITMNMVPFPRFHFLLPSASPLSTAAAPAALRPSGPGAHRAIDHLFYDVMSREHQLIKCDPRGGVCLACGLLARGNVSMADVSRNMPFLRAHMQMAHWNGEGFKIGLCDRAPLGAPNSLLCITNNCCIGDTFGAMEGRFQKLFKRRVYVHHYTQFMDAEDMQAAADNVASMQHAYADLAGQQAPELEEVYKPQGLSFVNT